MLEVDLGQMQVSSTAENSQGSFYDGLRELIAQPNPMCLAIVRAQPQKASYSEQVPGATDVQSRTSELMDLLHNRLNAGLRQYDVAARIEDSGFVVVFRTLADVQVLDSRLLALHGELVEPYTLERGTAHLPVVIGGAVRIPAEKPSALMRRAEQALNLAISAGGKAPVLL